MLQQLLSAQLERGHCVKWRGWLTAIAWPGRGWLLREFAGVVSARDTERSPQSDNGTARRPDVGDLSKGKEGPWRAPSPWPTKLCGGSVGSPVSLRAATNLSITAVAK
jgi:hypothetical protein